MKQYLNPKTETIDITMDMLMWADISIPEPGLQHVKGFETTEGSI